MTATTPSELSPNNREVIAVWAMLTGQIHTSQSVLERVESRYEAIVRLELDHGLTDPRLAIVQTDLGAAAQSLRSALRSLHHAHQTLRQPPAP